MIERRTAQAATAALTAAISDLLQNWAEVPLGDDAHDPGATAVTARMLESALADISALAAAIRALARWTDEAEEEEGEEREGDGLAGEFAELGQELGLIDAVTTAREGAAPLRTGLAV